MKVAEREDANILESGSVKIFMKRGGSEMIDELRLTICDFRC